LKYFYSKICRIYREKEMTLPKGYNPPNKGGKNNNNNYRPPRRPINKGRLAVGIIFFILFVIGLVLTYHNYLNTVKAGEELDEQKKIVQQTKKDYEKAFYDLYGRYPSYPSEYPPKTPP
jgi:hypothetical protein